MLPGLFVPAGPNIIRPISQIGTTQKSNVTTNATTHDFSFTAPALSGRPAGLIFHHAAEDALSRTVSSVVIDPAGLAVTMDKIVEDDGPNIGDLFIYSAILTALFPDSLMGGSVTIRATYSGAVDSGIAWALWVQDFKDLKTATFSGSGSGGSGSATVASVTGKGDGLTCGVVSNHDPSLNGHTWPGLTEGTESANAGLMRAQIATDFWTSDYGPTGETVTSGDGNDDLSVCIASFR